jgi:UDP-N-acetylglucosamine:LPS N-acetylglucosamine transferase
VLFRSEDHQRNNAFSYASTGAASVLEEKNLTPQILKQEIDRIARDFSVAEEMRTSTQKSRFPDAAKTIAEEIISVAFTHES